MTTNTTSSHRRRRNHVMSLRLTATELAQLRVLAGMARCSSPAEFLRRLLDEAHEKARRDLQRF